MRGGVGGLMIMMMLKDEISLCEEDAQSTIHDLRT